MTRSMKLAALAGALAVLTVGPGCGMFDGYCDDCNTTGSYSTEYQRDGLGWMSFLRTFGFCRRPATSAFSNRPTSRRG